MRKLVLLAVAFIAAWNLTGCHPPVTGGDSGTVNLPETFIAQADIQYGERSYAGIYRRSVTGDASFELSLPQSLNGMTLSISEGDLILSYGALSFTLGKQVQSDKSVMQILASALNSLNGVTFIHPSGQGPFKMEVQDACGQIKTVVKSADGNAARPSNFFPERITIDNLRFDVVFTSLE